MGVATLRRRLVGANRPTIDPQLGLDRIRISEGRSASSCHSCIGVNITSGQWALTEKRHAFAKVRPTTWPLAQVRRNRLCHSQTFPCRLVPAWSRAEASTEATSITNSVPGYFIALIGSDRIPDAKPWDIFISRLFPSPTTPSLPAK